MRVGREAKHRPPTNLHPPTPNQPVTLRASANLLRPLRPHEAVAEALDLDLGSAHTSGPQYTPICKMGVASPTLKAVAGMKAASPRLGLGQGPAQVGVGGRRRPGDGAITGPVQGALWAVASSGPVQGQGRAGEEGGLHLGLPPPTPAPPGPSRHQLTRVPGQRLQVRPGFRPNVSRGSWPSPSPSLASVSLPGC